MPRYGMNHILPPADVLRHDPGVVDHARGRLRREVGVRMLTEMEVGRTYVVTVAEDGPAEHSDRQSDYLPPWEGRECRLVVDVSPIEEHRVQVRRGIPMHPPYCDLCGHFPGPGDGMLVSEDGPRPTTKLVCRACLGPWADREQERRAGIDRD